MRKMDIKFRDVFSIFYRMKCWVVDEAIRVSTNNIHFHDKISFFFCLFQLSEKYHGDSKRVRISHGKQAHWSFTEQYRSLSDTEFCGVWSGLHCFLVLFVDFIRG